MFESIRIKLDRRNISKIVSMLLLLSEISGLVSLGGFMGTVAVVIAVHMKPESYVSCSSVCDPCVNSCLQVSRDHCFSDEPSIASLVLPPCFQE